MSKRRIGLHEISYERFEEAERRAPHAPLAMLSGSTRGPVQMWICPMGRCGEVRYVYSSSSTLTPVCDGGMRWSFITAGGAFDTRVHQPWAETPGGDR